MADTRAHGVRGEHRPQRAVVIDGPDRGRSVSIAAPTSIGTSELTDLVLSDPTVSRRHVVLEPTDQGTRARDGGSKNGTYAGGVRVFDACLAEGAELRLGSTILRLEPDRFTRDAARQLDNPFPQFIGRAPALAPLFARLAKVIPSDRTILIEGESGVGKEVLAESIHAASPRAAGPFVVVDCGALPLSLIEAELFGHELGAFTGATHSRRGAFGEAEGGTIFLDEIGELPIAAQTQLLRVLDRKQIKRVGAAQRATIDVRIVAATHRDLEAEVEAGRFRLDLFHRLAVTFVRVPPLRERPEDIEPLARMFVTRCGAEPDQVLGPATVAALRGRAWPGNVRELRNYVEQLALFGAEPAWRASTNTAATGSDPLQRIIERGLPFRQARAAVLELFGERYVSALLAAHGGSVAKAAAAAGIAQRHLYRLKRPGSEA